jgi:alpha/beta superfamily hydrolase
MTRRVAFALCAALAALLTGCGKSTMTATVASSTDTNRGTLIYNPPVRMASVDAPTLTEELSSNSSGQQLLELAGTPNCGVDVYYLEYYTVGAKSETATASGAMMVPTGTGPPCAGPRPIVLYAHKTAATKSYNLANIADTTNEANTESLLLATAFASQGYIVVAPNYAGYDISNLPYHPFANADQQSKDMADALTAARTALPNTFTPGTSDNGQLFVTGYSQGGFVAMATVRAMTAAGETVTASAPMSGPYAFEALGDAVFLGTVVFGSTEFAPLITTSYQEAYGNIYSEPTDIYEPQYAPKMFELLPSNTPLDTLFANGTLPELALFSSSTPTTATYPQLTPQLAALLAIPANGFAAGFGTANLITNDYRVSYAIDAVTNPDGAVLAPPSVALAATPQNTLRIAFKTNDMRDGPFWAPHAPMLMCGGDQDPTIIFSLDTGTMATYWTNLPPGLITVLDLNAAPAANDPFAPLQVAFQQEIASILATYGPEGVAGGYHLAALPFCTVAARDFFSKF